MLLIDDDLQPQGFTQAAREWFALLKAREKAEHTPLPTHVYAVVGRLLAAEAGDDPKRPPRVRVRASDPRWAIIEAARMEGVANAIAVSVHGASAEDIALVARAHGLTPRERELVALVLEGLDSASSPSGCSSLPTPSRTTSSRCSTGLASTAAASWSPACSDKPPNRDWPLPSAASAAAALHPERAQQRSAPDRPFRGMGAAQPGELALVSRALMLGELR